MDEAHLASYLNEFVFRFNRRRSRSRGMVFYRVLEHLPSPTTRCATRISSPPSGPGQCRPRRRKGGGTHRAWSALLRSAPRELRAWTDPVKWIPQRRSYGECLAGKVSGQSRHQPRWIILGGNLGYPCHEYR